MRGTLRLAITGALFLLGLLMPAGANAFGITQFSTLVADESGNSSTQAGAHPYTQDVSFDVPALGFFEVEANMKDVEADLPPGLVPNPQAIPATCTVEQLVGIFATDRCPPQAQVGVAHIRGAVGPGESGTLPFNLADNHPIYVMEAPTGYPALLAFAPASNITFISPKIRDEGDYGVTSVTASISQVLPITGTTIELWGVPADPSHDGDRGFRPGHSQFEIGSAGIHCARLQEDSKPECSHSAGYTPTPFLTNPMNCSAGAMPATLRLDSWQEPGVFHTETIDHDRNGNPNIVTGCEKVPLDPELELAPSTDQVETPSGLDVNLEIPDTGFLNPDGLSQAHLKRVKVTLPEGVSVNPSSAEGLGVCTPADLAREKVNSLPGAGCPNQSKIGSVDIETPVLEEHVTGSLYLAQQDDPATAGHENPFDTMIALYIVAKNKERGIIVRMAGKVEPDPRTGQLISTFDDLPQLPFSKFHLHFREGARAPLVSPRACGTFTTQAEFVPWSAADPENPTADEVVHTTSQFQITKGVSGGPCPAGGLPPFKPGLTAGTVNNAAGRFSPFNLRLTRNDGEQEFTRFSIKLPPGIVAKLNGVPFCPDAAIEAAKSRTGAAELAAPSCPKASEVGRTLVGAGAGSIQTYVPGKIYFAGPYNGSADSIVAITAAKVGPFDAGTVVIRQALKVDPDTAEVFIDSVGSDPIPHIIKGIPVHARDIRAYVDKPEFVLNPTSCDRTSTASTLLGSGLDFASEADNNPITVTSPFQAADCAALPFKPKLSLRLIGGTKRGDHPKFRAHLKMNGIGEAAIERAQVTLPKSEFLENANIRTICTRVQFNKGTVPGEQCPEASVYGYAKATTPILDEPLEGPVFLRSSEHELPDLVGALHSGKININVVGRIDSVKGGGLRNTFEAVPDAPVSTFTLTMQGGKKGLLVNSTNLCKGTHKAKVAFDGHNGKFSDSRIPLQAKCKGKAKKRNRAR